jgi:hypothetical protein
MTSMMGSPRSMAYCRVTQTASKACLNFKYLIFTSSLIRKQQHNESKLWICCLVVCVPTIVITSTIVALKVHTQTSRTVLQFYAPIANETKRPVFIISFSLVFCYVIMVQPNNPLPPPQRAQHSLSHFHHHRQQQRHNQHSSSIAANGQKSASR